LRKPSDLVQGTLDMLILKILALEPLNGLAVRQRLKQTSRDVLGVSDGSLHPALAGGDPRASAVQGSLDQSLEEGCRHADEVFGNHYSAGTACALVQPALRRESDASHVDTTSVLACTNRARMSEIQAIWVNFERESRFPKLLKIIETKVGNGAVWTESLCAHGRCATRLRYAPTLLLH
jgi:hypothetical protein